MKYQFSSVIYVLCYVLAIAIHELEYISIQMQIYHVFRGMLY